MSESPTTRSTGLSLFGIALVVNCAIALFALLLSWFIGGDAYKDSLYGNYAIPVLVLGMAGGGAVWRFCRRQTAAGAQQGA